jgi:hypothetical protein
MAASITETRDLIQPQTLSKYNYIWIRPDSEVQKRWSLNKSHYQLCWTKFKVEDVTNTIEVTESVDLLTEESSEGIDGSTQTEQEATTETESTTASFLSMGSMGSASSLSMGSFVDSIHENDEAVKLISSTKSPKTQEKSDVPLLHGEEHSSVVHQVIGYFDRQDNSYESHQHHHIEGDEAISSISHQVTNSNDNNPSSGIAHQAANISEKQITQIVNQYATQNYGISDLGHTVTESHTASAVSHKTEDVHPDKNISFVAHKIEIIKTEDNGKTKLLEEMNKMKEENNKNETKDPGKNVKPKHPEQLLKEVIPHPVLSLTNNRKTRMSPNPSQPNHFSNPTNIFNYGNPDGIKSRSTDFIIDAMDQPGTVLITSLAPPPPEAAQSERCDKTLSSRKNIQRQKASVFQFSLQIFCLIFPPPLDLVSVPTCAALPLVSRPVLATSGEDIVTPESAIEEAENSNYQSESPQVEKIGIIRESDVMQVVNKDSKDDTDDIPTNKYDEYYESNANATNNYSGDEYENTFDVIPSTSITSTQASATVIPNQSSADGVIKANMSTIQTGSQSSDQNDKIRPNDIPADDIGSDANENDMHDKNVKAVINDINQIENPKSPIINVNDLIPLLQNNVFTSLNTSGIVTTFDGADLDLPTEITNDTLVIFQDIFVGPDGIVNLTSTSNLNGLFDDNALNAIRDSLNIPSTNVVVDKIVPSEIVPTAITTSKEDKKIESEDGKVTTKAGKTDVDNISEADLQYIIMRSLPDLDADTITKIQIILRLYGGQLDLSFLHEIRANKPVTNAFTREDLVDDIRNAIKESQNENLNSLNRANTNPIEDVTSVQSPEIDDHSDTGDFIQVLPFENVDLITEPASSITTMEPKKILTEITNGNESDEASHLNTEKGVKGAISPPNLRQNTSFSGNDTPGDNLPESGHEIILISQKPDNLPGPHGLSNKQVTEKPLNLEDSTANSFFDQNQTTWPNLSKTNLSNSIDKSVNPEELLTNEIDDSTRSKNVTTQTAFDANENNNVIKPNEDVALETEHATQSLDVDHNQDEAIKQDIAINEKETHNLSLVNPPNEQPINPVDSSGGIIVTVPSDKPEADFVNSSPPMTKTIQTSIEKTGETNTDEDPSVETGTEVITESEQGSEETEDSEEIVTDVASATETTTAPSLEEVTEVDVTTESKEGSGDAEKSEETVTRSDSTDKESVTETEGYTEVVTESENEGTESNNMQSVTEVSSEGITTVSQETETAPESDDLVTEETATETVSQETVTETEQGSGFTDTLSTTTGEETETVTNLEETATEIVSQTTYTILTKIQFPQYVLWFFPEKYIKKTLACSNLWML